MKKFFRNYNFLYLLILVPLLAGCPPFSSDNSGSGGGTVEVSDTDSTPTVLVSSTTGVNVVDRDGSGTLQINALTKGGTAASKYVVVSNNTSIATVTNAGPPFTITGVANGATSIVVIDTANSNALGGFSLTVIGD